MTRLFFGVTTFFAAALLSGCPIYSGPSQGSGGGGAGACGPSGCFECPSGSTPADGTCIPWTCSSPADCPSGYTCASSTPRGGLYCVPLSSTPDASDCSGGCPSGYVCKLAGGRTQCVASPPVDAGSGSVDATTFDVGASEAGSGVIPDASHEPDTFNPPDAPGAASSADASPAPDAFVIALCNASVDCSMGAKCINGACTPQGALCSDTTQCVASGEACVDGVCEPHCSAGVPCPAGYGCDFARGVCNVNPDPCAGSGTSTCQGGSTCVEGHCVAPCATGDAGTACPASQVCVNGGCIPNEAAQFSCKNDGKSGALATACATTEICLHHDCYSGCDPDAGAGACANPAAVCKEVTVAAGTYVVCGTSSNLGSDCDPAAGRSCSGGVCIDGYCK